MLTGGPIIMTKRNDATPRNLLALVSRDTLRGFASQWWRMLLVQLLALLAVSIPVIAVTAGVVLGKDGIMRFLAANPLQAEGRLAGVGIAVALGAVLLSLPFLVAALIAIATLVDPGVDRGKDRSARFRPALRTGVMRLFPAGAALLVAIALCFGALIVSPFLVLAGLLGLLVTSVLRLARPELAKRHAWANPARWGFIAIPFAVALRQVATAFLLFPVAVFEGSSPRRVWGAAMTLAKHRRVLILVVAGIATLLSVALVSFGALLGTSIGSGIALTLVGTLVEFIAIPLPTVVAVMLYRRLGGEGALSRPSKVPARAPGSDAATRVGKVSPAYARLAAVTAAAIAISGIVLPPAAAVAVAGNSYTVTSNADALDAGVIAAQQASCAMAGGDCTLRGALRAAQAAAEAGAEGARISFASGMTISVAGPLTFSPAETPALVSGAVLEIDGGGQGVVLDGAISTQIMLVTSEFWNLRVAGLTMQNGWAQDGAALLAGVNQTSLDRVVFENNTASTSAGAVFGRALTVTRSTFINNRARYYGALASGGAIRATGAVSVENSTFSQNAVGDEFSGAIDRGADVYSDGPLTVRSSTFSNYERGSLSTASTQATVTNSIFTTNWGSGGSACRGPVAFSGGNNIMPNGDTTCPGTQGTQTAFQVLSVLDTTGAVPVFPLNPSAGNPAMQRGADCPAEDALGRTRPAQGCDLGSAETEGGTSLTLETVPDAAQFGRVALRATVTSVSGAVPTGEVNFVVDGGAGQTVSLAAVPGVAGAARAELSVDLAGIGVSHAVTAAYVPDGVLRPSDASTDYTPQPLRRDVSLDCFGGEAHTTAGCTSADWNIVDSASIDLAATLAPDSEPGTITLTSDEAGQHEIAAPVAVDQQNRTAEFTLSGTDLGLGAHSIYAAYRSDSQEYVGLSPLRTVTVLRTPTVTLSMPGGSGQYGDQVAGLATVAVTGAQGAATPTGSVTVRGQSAQLDATGTAHLDLSLLPGGDQQLTASYTGDSVYGAAESNLVTYRTTQTSSSIAIESVDPAGARFGDAISATIRVGADTPSTADPFGTVTVVADAGTPAERTFDPVSITPDATRDGSVMVTAPIAAGVLTGGEHELTATFTPTTASFAASSTVAPFGVEIAAAATTTSLAASADHAAFGEQVTLTATVTGPGLGGAGAQTVAFAAGSRALGTATTSPCGGDPNCAVATLIVDAETVGLGAVDLTASLEASPNYAASRGEIAGYAVAKATPTVTMQAPGALFYQDHDQISVHIEAAGYLPADGAEVVLEARAAGGAPIPLGSVHLTNGSKTMPLNPAALGLLPGSYTLTASFAGNDSFEAGSATTTLEVRAAATRVSWDSSALPGAAAFGDSVTVPVTVTNTSTGERPEGEVVLTWNGVELGRSTLGDAHDASGASRTVTVRATFGAQLTVPTDGRLTAEFVPAAGFAVSKLSEAAPDDRKVIVLQPVPAAVDLQLTAVLGQALAAEATVTAGPADLGIVPRGYVTFTLNRSGLGLQELGPVALVDGRVSLAEALTANHLDPVLVDLAGTWSVRATYQTGNLDPRIVAQLPASTALKSVNITAGSSGVTAAAPNSIELGQTLRVTASVVGAVTPTGRVRVERWDGAGYQTVSDETDLAHGDASIVVNGSLPLGTQQLRVHYVGNGTLAAANSAPFEVSVQPASSTVTVTSVNSPYPAIIGGKAGYTATVTSALGAPAGYVTFFRDSTQIGQATLAPELGGGSASASILVPVGEAWSGDIVARVTSGQANIVGGEGRLAHRWQQAPVLLELNGPLANTIGSPSNYFVTAQLDWHQFQYLPELLRPAAPSGTVTISDGSGAVCHANLVDQGGQLSRGSCNLSFDGVGQHSVTAEFAGDHSYEPETSAALITTVSKGTPTLTLTAPEEPWRGLTSIPVSWNVVGPDQGGTVTVTRGTQTVCSSASMSGSCEVPIPAFDRSQFGARLLLQYSGTPNWNYVDKSVTGSIDACVPYLEPVALPVGSATVTVSPGQTTCGSGEAAGFYVSDRIVFSATPEPGRRITGFSGAPVGEYGDRFPYPKESISFGSNGSAWMIASPTVVTDNGVQVPFTAAPVTEAECITATIRVTGLPAGMSGRDVVDWFTNQRCGLQSTKIDNSRWQVPIEAGSKLTVRYYGQTLPERMKFYGWQGAFAGDAFADRASYTIVPDSNVIDVPFGPVCFTGTPKLAQPSDGTITVTLAKPNCYDPQTKTSGWTFGSVGLATLSDSVGESVQSVKQTYTLPNGAARSYDTTAWVAQKPVYFERWIGATDQIRDYASDTSTDANGVRRSSRTVLFKIAERPYDLSASYGRCATLGAEVIGDSSAGPPGTITMQTDANCPLGAGYNGERWYKLGTQVSLSTAATSAVKSSTSLKFLGWAGAPIAKNQLLSPTISFALNEDARVTASYGTNANCRPLKVQAVPAGALSLDTKFSLGSNACAAMYGDKFYDQGTSGNGITIDASAATTEAQGAETVFVWSTNEPNTNNEISKIWSRSSSLNEELYGPSQVIAYACEFVKIDAAVSAPGGTVVASAGATNMTRDSKIDRFVQTQDANCGTGSDPKSGYAGYAWTVGTELTPLVAADPAAYRFTGWSGDASGSGESPNAPVKLVGAGHTASGQNYHYRVTANFEAICYTLSIPSDADKVEVLTAPNCPGVDASKHQYLGGTAVVLHAADKGDTLFRNWVSGVDAVDDDPHWASVIMDSDAKVVPYYSTKSVGEQLSSYGALVGDAMAIASKKMVGIASAAVAAYVKVLFSKVTLVAQGISYAAQGLELLGVHGAGLDAVKNGAAAMENMIALMWAPLDCITAWSAGGENTAVYAAQNAIGVAVVTALSSGAQQQSQSAPDSTLAKLKAQAQAAKAAATPGTQAVKAITAAKSVYDAAAAGNIGIETSAYEAWGSQASLDVFSTCMTNRATGTMESMWAVGG